MPPSTPRLSYSIQDALRLRRQYRDKITDLQQFIDDREEEIEELQERVIRQEEICEQARTGDQNVYEKQLRYLKIVQKQLKKVTARLLQLTVELRKVRQLRERRLRMIGEQASFEELDEQNVISTFQNGVFPFRDITNRREFGMNRQQ